MSEQKQAYFLELYEPVHDRFERFCRARVYGEMDYRDLMNETLLIAYHKLDSLRSEPAFFSFICSVSVRILANNKRKHKPAGNASEQQLHNLVDATAQTDRDTEVMLLHRALALLPENQREAIILFEISGFSLKEVSQIQQASLSAVKQRLKRGRERLHQLLSFESSHKMGEVRHE